MDGDKPSGREWEDTSDEAFRATKLPVSMSIAGVSAEIAFHAVDGDVEGVMRWAGDIVTYTKMRDELLELMRAAPVPEKVAA